MPDAVTHILVPIFVIALIRDFYLSKKSKSKFPLHYVLIAGIGGALPDIDIIIFYFLKFLGYSFEAVHRTFTHSLFFPLIFLVLYFVLKSENLPVLGRHKLRLNMVCLMLAFGILTHLVLDWLVAGIIMPLYPFSHYSMGLNLVNYLPSPLNSLFPPTLDGVLLFLWLIYLEWKHKISDFI